MSVYRYAFQPEIPFASVKSSLVMALLAVESIVGEPEMVLSIEHATDEEKRTVAIAGGSRAGDLLNKLFVGFVLREFGQEAFLVERIRSESSDA